MPAGDKDYAEFNVDALFEKKLGGGSFVTAEAAYYHLNVNDGGVSDSLYVLAAYATPTVGVGQHPADGSLPVGEDQGQHRHESLEHRRGLSYLIKGPALRVVATYSHTKLVRRDWRVQPDRQLHPARRAGDLLLDLRARLASATIRPFPNTTP